MLLFIIGGYIYMRNYDNEMLKTNISKLRDDNRMSQKDFAAIAGIHQSRLSTLLGDDKGNRFSIEQIYRIASRFGVSIDYLVTGREPEPISTAKQVCEVIVSLFENFHLDNNDFERSETIDIPMYTIDKDGHKIPELDTEKRTIKYHALFFSHCWGPNPDREYTEDELDELQMDDYYNGNEITENIAINKFLDAFIPVFKLHDAGKMPDEAYKYTINSLLDSIS